VFGDHPEQGVASLGARPAHLESSPGFDAGQRLRQRALEDGAGLGCQNAVSFWVLKI
jgi:hypothetical protein